MKISIMGLGYVGAVSAGCLAEEGHEVIGVDPQKAKVDLINAGRTPIIERDIGGIIERNVLEGRLRATSDVFEAVRHTDYETAEMVKYADNTWHALKVAFANEIGNICKGLGLDSHKLMDIFCQDTKLNLSPYYLKPGFAFGGSCLPKDVRALSYKAKTLDIAVPVINAILPSNQAQVERGIRAVIDKGSKRVGILGFSFKAGTDDLRESPLVELVERLIGKGYDLRVYDSNVRLASIHGANREYILEHIPHISKLMVGSVQEVLDHASTIVIGNASPEFREVPRLLGPGQSVVDLVRISAACSSVEGVYDGICW